MSMYQKGAPYEQEIKAGETVYICRCGLTESAPFCDGSHTGKPGVSPLEYAAQRDETLYICGCGKTGNVPMCDGSHNG
jgi:CDGSH-type Zn-finger protein